MKGSRRSTPTSPRRLAASRKSIKLTKSRRSKRSTSTYALIGAAAASLVAVGLSGYFYYSRQIPKPPVELDVFIRNEKAENSDNVETGIYMTVFLNDEKNKQFYEKMIKNIPSVEHLDITTGEYEDIRKTGADFAIRVAHHGPGDLDHTHTDGSEEQLTITSLYSKIRGMISQSRARPSMIPTVDEYYKLFGCNMRDREHNPDPSIGEFWRVVEEVEHMNTQDKSRNHWGAYSRSRTFSDSTDDIFSL